MKVYISVFIPREHILSFAIVSGKSAFQSRISIAIHLKLRMKSLTITCLFFLASLIFNTAYGRELTNKVNKNSLWRHFVVRQAISPQQKQGEVAVSEIIIFWYIAN